MLRDQCEAQWQAHGDGESTNPRNRARQQAPMAAAMNGVRRRHAVSKNRSKRKVKTMPAASQGRREARGIAHGAKEERIGELELGGGSNVSG